MNKNSLFLFCAVLFGFIFHQGHEFSFLIKYLLLPMLFFPFLKVSLPKSIHVYRDAILLSLVMSASSLLAYVALKNWDNQSATIAFLLLATPTATAAPVVIGFLHKNVGYVTTAVVTTNGLSAFLLPFALGFIVSRESNDESGNAWFTTAAIVGIALLSAQWIKSFCPRLTVELKKIDQLPFVLWLLVIYLATATASDYLYSHYVPLPTLAKIGLISLLACGFNFLIGYRLGGSTYAIECSQSLGQKNTMLASWIALEYLSPLEVMAPICYLVWQNLYNAVLLNKELDKQPSN